MEDHLTGGHIFYEHLEEAIRNHADEGWREDLRSCVPRLIALIDGSHARPMIESTKAVRAVIADHCMRGDLGEAHPGGGVMLESHVRLLVTELEKCRQLLIKDGDWSDVPVPPQMFG